MSNRFTNKQIAVAILCLCGSLNLIISEKCSLKLAKRYSFHTTNIALGAKAHIARRFLAKFDVPAGMCITRADLGRLGHTFPLDLSRAKSCCFSSLNVLAMNVLSFRGSRK